MVLVELLVEGPGNPRKSPQQKLKGGVTPQVTVGICATHNGMAVGPILKRVITIYILLQNLRYRFNLAKNLCPDYKGFS